MFSSRDLCSLSEAEEKRLFHTWQEDRKRDEDIKRNSGQAFGSDVIPRVLRKSHLRGRSPAAALTASDYSDRGRGN